MKRATVLLVAAGILLAAGPARGDQTWTQNQHATNLATGAQFSLDGMPAPVLGKFSPLRLDDLTLCAGGPLWVNATGLPFRCATIGNTAGGADLQAPLAPADGTIVMPTAGTIRVGAVPGTGVTGAPNTIAWFNGSGLLSSLTLAPEFALTTGTLSIAAGGITTVKLATGAVTTPILAAGAVTYAKIQNEAPGTFLGNPTGSPAPPSEITPDGTSVAFSGSTLQRQALAGAVTAAAGSGTTAFGAAPALSALVNATNGSLVPSFLGPAGANQALVGTAAGTGVAWGPITAAATTGIVANWPIANVRYYAVDGTFGIDTNTCSSDTSIADAGTKACATIAGLLSKFPTVPAGHKAVVVVNRGTYADDPGPLFASIGWSPGYPLLFTTGTLASAGAVAFAGDAGDAVALGAVTATGMNAAGYNPTGAATTTVIPCTKVGGADPGFPAESTVPLPLGARIRFDSATATVALRNVARTVVEIDGTDTLRVPVTNPLPATPSASDRFYIEMPGVVVPSVTTIGIGGGTVAGLAVSGNVNQSGRAGSMSYVFTHFASSVSFSDTSFSLGVGYSHPSAGFITVGGVRQGGSIFSVSRSSANFQSSVVAGQLSYLAGATLITGGTTVFHDVLLKSSGYGAAAGSSGITFGTLFSNDYVRVLSNDGHGNAVSIAGSHLTVQNVQFASGQFAYAFTVSGTSDVAFNPGIPYSGVGIAGFGQSKSAAFDLRGSNNSTITLLNYSATPTLYTGLTGATADFSLSGLTIGSGTAIAAYADIAAMGTFIDSQGNRIAAGTNNQFVAQTVLNSAPVAVLNNTGSDIPPGRVIKLEETTNTGLALGDTDAHMPGPLAITTTINKTDLTTYEGYVATNLERYTVLTDGPLTHDADVYVSATVPGAVTTTVPSAGQPMRRIGKALDTAIIKFDPELGNPITTGLVPTSRTVTGTAPISIAGDHAAHDLSANRTWALDTNGVTYPFLQQGAALSIPGRSANSLGNWADIVATAGAGGVFRESGSTLGFGDITEGRVTNLTTDLAAKVPTARAINTTLPLTGGGNLSVDRTLGINVFGASGTLHSTGAVPDPGAVAGATKFIREDSTWAVPSASGAAGGALTGSYPNPSIANGVIVGANFSNFAANTLFGNPTGSAAAPTTITLGTGLSFSGGALNVTVAGGADALGSYWVSGASHAPANAVNWGLLGNGVLQQTTSGSVSTPSVFTAGVDQMAFGAASGGGLQTDADWTLNPATHAISGTGSISLQGAVTTIGAWNGVGTYVGGVVGAFGVGANRVPFGSGVSGGITDSANMTFVSNALTLGAANGSAVAINLTGGVQSIEKGGTGDLWMGTLGTQAFHLYTANTTRLTFDSAGNFQLPHLATAGHLRTDASGNVDVDTTAYQPIAYPGANLILFSGGTSSPPAGDSTFVWDPTNHVAHLSGSNSSGTSVILDRAGVQTIEKQGSGDLWLGTLGAQAFHLYTNNATALTIDSSRNIIVNSLSGTGTRCVHADASGTLSPTASDCGSGGGSVTGVTATAPLASSGGTAPNISLNTSGVTPGTYVIGNGSFTVDGHGLITGASGATAYTASSVNGGGTVAGSQLNFVGPFTESLSSGIATITLAIPPQATTTFVFAYGAGNYGANLPSGGLGHAPDFWFRPMSYTVSAGEEFAAFGQVWEYDAGDSFGNVDLFAYVYECGISITGGSQDDLVFEVTKNGVRTGRKFTVSCPNVNQLNTQYNTFGALSVTSTDRVGVEVYDTATGVYSSGALRATVTLRLRP